MCVGQLSIEEMNGVFTALGGSAIELIVPGVLHMRWFGCGWDFAIAALGGAWYRRSQHRQIATDDHGERCLSCPLLERLDFEWAVTLLHGSAVWTH